MPEQGWPWPWKDSCTTDYSYAWVEGAGVLASCFGHKWFKATQEPENDEEDSTKTAIFPDMTNKQQVALGKRSGLILLGGA